MHDQRRLMGGVAWMLFALVACSSDDDSASESEFRRGCGSSDAGAASDTGTGSVDAGGARPDGGTTGTDSGAPGSDTGTPPPPPPGGLNLPRVPWEGGPDYWSRFSMAKAAGWTDPARFPIGVWFETLYNASALKAVGINTIVGANHDGASLTAASQNGISVIIQDEWSQAEVGSSGAVVGWLASDEMDMNSGTPVQDQTTQVNKLRGFADGRFVYSNYGKGSIGTWWNPDSLPALVQMVDVASDDLYFYTDPNLPYEAPQSQFWTSGATVRSSASYGFTMRRMRGFLDQAKLHPTWNFVEDGHPFSEPEAQSPTITPEHTEGAVWASIINEARGIIYFNHSFGGACQSQHVMFDCNPAMKTRLTTMNAQIQALAPVLNTQSYVFAASTDADTMIKVYDGSLYIFAGIGEKGTTGTKNFKLPPGVNGTTVTVVDENRTIPVSAGGFSDGFAAEYTHHVYRVPL